MIVTDRLWSATPSELPRWHRVCVCPQPQSSHLCHQLSIFIAGLVICRLFLSVLPVPTNHTILDLFQTNINSIDCDLAILSPPTVNFRAFRDRLLIESQSAQVGLRLLAPGLSPLWGVDTGNPYLVNLTINQECQCVAICNAYYVSDQGSRCRSHAGQCQQDANDKPLTRKDKKPQRSRVLHGRCFGFRTVLQ